MPRSWSSVRPPQKWRFSPIMTPVDGPIGHELLDCGDGRRLERFGPRLVDRPAPAAVEGRRLPPARVARGRPRLRPGPRLDRPEPVALDGRDRRTDSRAATDGGRPDRPVSRARDVLAVAPGRSSGIGRGRRSCTCSRRPGRRRWPSPGRARRSPTSTRPRPAVAWARRNAELSGLADRPVRWIVDDALALHPARGPARAPYDGIVLDPPCWGHAASGERWELADSLPDLLDAAAAVATRRGRVLLTAHTTGLDPVDLEAALADAFAGRGSISAEPLVIYARSGAEPVGRGRGPHDPRMSETPDDARPLVRSRA